MDGIDSMLDSGRGVERSLEVGPPSAASQEALKKMRDARKILTEARSAVARIRNWN